MCSRKRNLLVGCILLPQRLSRLTLASGPVRYLAWSGVSFVANVGLSVGLHEVVRLPAEWSFLLALVTMYFVNFCGLRCFVYRSVSQRPVKQFGTYVISASGFRVGEYLAFLIMHTLLGGPYRATVVGVLLASFLCKYAFYKYVVFERF